MSAEEDIGSGFLKEVMRGLKPEDKATLFALLLSSIGLFLYFDHNVPPQPTLCISFVLVFACWFRWTKSKRRSKRYLILIVLLSIIWLGGAWSQFFGAHRRVSRLMETAGKLNDLGWYSSSLENYKEAREIAHNSNLKSSEMRCLLEMGSQYAILGQADQGRECFTTCQKIAIENESDDAYSEATFKLGEIAMIGGNLDSARQYYTEARQKLSTTNNIGEARCLYGLAFLDMVSGNVDAAQAELIRSAKLFAVARSAEIGNVFIELEEIAEKKNNEADVRLYFSQATNLFEHTKNPLGQGRAFHILGDLELSLHNYDKARADLSTAHGILQKTGSTLDQANALRSLAKAEMQLKRNALAREYFQQALVLFDKTSPDGKASILGFLGDMYAAEGQYAQAQTNYEAAELIYQSIGDVLGEAQIMSGRAEMARKTNNFAEAKTAFLRAHGIFRDVKNLRGQADTLTALGDLDRDSPRVDEASRNYQEALEIYDRLRLGPEAEYCRRKINSIQNEKAMSEILLPPVSE